MNDLLIFQVGIGFVVVMALLLSHSFFEFVRMVWDGFVSVTIMVVVLHFIVKYW